MLKILIITVLGSLWACIEGTREAYAHHNSTLDKNMHPQYFIQRSLVMIMSVISLKWNISVMVAVAGMSVFSFWHNGAYYTLRNRLTPGYAPKKWRDHRDGSALMDIPYQTRLIMMIAGYLLVAAAIYLNHIQNGIF